MAIAGVARTDSARIREEGLKPEVAARRFIEQNPELVYYGVGDLIPNYPKPTSLR